MSVPSLFWEFSWITAKLRLLFYYIIHLQSDVAHFSTEKDFWSNVTGQWQKMNRDKLPFPARRAALYYFPQCEKRNIKSHFIWALTHTELISDVRETQRRDGCSLQLILLQLFWSLCSCDVFYGFHHCAVSLSCSRTHLWRSTNTNRGWIKNKQTKNQELCNQQYVVLKVKKKNLIQFQCA